MKNKRFYEKPPRDGCGGYKDEWNGDYDCTYAAPFNCEECMYGPDAPRGKNPQAKKWYKDTEKSTH